MFRCRIFVGQQQNTGELYFTRKLSKLNKVEVVFFYKILSQSREKTEMI